MQLGLCGVFTLIVVGTAVACVVYVPVSLQRPWASTDAACLIAERTARHTLVSLNIGTPPRRVKLLVRADSVIDAGNDTSTTNTAAIRIWRSDVHQSSSIRCTHGEVHHSVCSDETSVLLHGGGTRSMDSRIGRVRFEWHPLALVDLANADGDVRLPLGMGVELLETHVCWSVSLAADVPAQSSLSHWSAPLIVETDAGRLQVAASGLTELDDARRDEWTRTVPMLECASCVAPLFPTSAMGTSRYVCATDVQLTRLKDVPSQVARDLLLLSETSSQCDGVLNVTESAKSVFTSTTTIYEAAYGSASPEMLPPPCRRAECLLLYDRVARHNILVSSAAKGSSPSWIRMSVDAPLRYIVSGPGSDKTDTDWTLSAVELLLVIAVTLAVYIQSDRDTSSGQHIFRDSVLRALEHSTPHPLDDRSPCYPPFSFWSGGVLLVILVCFHAALSFSFFDDVYSAALSAGVCVLPVAAVIIASIWHTDFRLMWKYSTVQWQDAIMSLVCVLVRLSMCNVRRAVLFDAALGRSVVTAQIAALLSLMHWYGRYYLIIVLRLGGSSILGGSNAIADGLGTLLLVYSVPPLVPSLGQFQAIARLLATLFATLLMPTRCAWSFMGAVHDLWLCWTGTFACPLSACSRAIWGVLSGVACVAWTAQLVAFVVHTLDLVIAPFVLEACHLLGIRSDIAIPLALTGTLTVATQRLAQQLGASEEREWLDKLRNRGMLLQDDRSCGTWRNQQALGLCLSNASNNAKRSGVDCGIASFQDLTKAEGLSERLSRVVAMHDSAQTCMHCQKVRLQAAIFEACIAPKEEEEKTEHM